MSRKVLVVDDEKLIVKGVRFSLEQDGMEVDCAYDGEEAVEKAKEKKYDIILLDLMLPKMDGLEVCQQIREFSNVPIVMLTAKGEDMDKILGLEYGADDYITKPFNILEVKARIKAIMRRAGSDHEEKDKAKNIQIGDLRMDCEGRRVFIADKEINLTAKEFDVLWMYISAAFVRKLKPIQVSRNMYTPNGAWDIISRHSRIINKRGQRFTDAGLFLICPTGQSCSMTLAVKMPSL